MLVFANIFQPLINVFDKVLLFLHDNVGLGWGMSIIALTVIVRTLMIPLTYKQIKSMQAMQQLGPEIKALQAKYKGDRQRLNQEMMKFYKENNVNPLGSCLPLVLQMPVFISLFYLLKSEGNIQGGFFFITDLTAKATGPVLVVLIVLYIVSQVASTLIMTPPTADNTQRRIFLLLPFFFVVFIIRFPAGLILYWITTNTWTVGQSYVVRRMRQKQPAPVLATAAGGAGEPATVAAAVPDQPARKPPPPPRKKKKKRSGRRR